MAVPLMLAPALSNAMGRQWGGSGPALGDGAKADVRLPSAPLRRVMVPLPVRGRFVTMLGAMMAVRGRGEILLHQRAAAAVPHDLLVGHAVAGADRFARKVHRTMSLVSRAAMRVGAPMMSRRPGMMTR